VLWPEDGYTKGELVAYYRSVAPFLLPYLAQRPLTLQRWPDGIHGFSFFEKNIPRGAPSWVPTYEVASNGKRATVSYVLCNDESTLVWLANLGSITLHVWMSRVEAIDNPDYVLFDLDPWEGCTLKTLAKVALTVQEVLESIGLTPLVKTSGGSGLHVVLPVKPVYDYEVLKAFGELVARRVASLRTGEVTLERMTKKRPAGTVYFDWVQIGKGKTIVPPFVVRAREGAPVSMPLAWSEIEKMSRKRALDTSPEFVRWNIGNVPALLEKSGDPWAAVARSSLLPLEPALEKAQATWPREELNVDAERSQ
jgi:bifunctional non-homologous end joining protein LigD